jgi:AraC-like DNA-binding protein
MIITDAARVSESPYLETVEHGWTAAAGSTIRPAERHSHLVLLKQGKDIQLLVVGALPTSGVVSWGEGGELIWIKLKAGTFMPHLPAKQVVEREIPLPNASRRAFWLKGAAWEFPTFENTETFVTRLVREEILVRDPVVAAVLDDRPHDLAARTVRHRFVHATGLTQNQHYQIERAQRAAALLGAGHSILDTAYDLGYFDQPHLTRSLKQWVGYTPAQIIQRSKPDCHFVQDAGTPVCENAGVLAEVRQL